MKLLKWAGFILIILLVIPTLFVYIGGYHQENFLQGSTQIEQQDDFDSKMKDELIGILAKEIPVTYEYEAIKAQTVIVRTYISRRQLGIEQKGELKGLTKEEMKATWAEDYQKIHSVYEQAIKDTGNQVIYYDNQMIEPVYHRESSGKTRSARYVYGMDIPYLQPVDSLQDQTEQEIAIRKTEVVEKLSNNYKELIADAKTLENQIQVVKRDESGYIRSIQVGNMLIDGEDFRKTVDIPSSYFEVRGTQKDLIFKVKGIGHGVGLSQSGANELAKQGKGYKDILKYYFKDVKIDLLET